MSKRAGSYMSNWSPRDNAHKLPVLWPFLMELHVTIALGVQGVVPAHADIDASMNSRATLTNQNAAGVNLLAAKNLDAQALGFGVPTVFTTAACFFMCHFKYLLISVRLFFRTMCHFNAFGAKAPPTRAIFSQSRL